MHGGEPGLAAGSHCPGVQPLLARASDQIQASLARTNVDAFSRKDENRILG